MRLLSGPPPDPQTLLVSEAAGENYDPIEYRPYGGNPESDHGESQYQHRDSRAGLADIEAMGADSAQKER